MIAALLALLNDVPVAAVFAWMVTAVLGLLLLREIRNSVECNRVLARDRATLAATCSELASARLAQEHIGAWIEAILAGMSDGVQVLDRDWKLVLWNDRFPECTGVPRELLRQGVPLEEMLRAQSRAGEFGAVDVETEVQRRLEILRGRREMGVVERVRPNGQVIELRRNPIAGSGIVTLYTDVTARRRGEAAQRDADRLRARAPADRATFLSMAAEAMQAELAGLRAALGGTVALQSAAAARVEELVDDLLLLHRLEAGALALEPTAFELRPMLQAALTAHAELAATARRRLQLQVAADVPGWVHGDRRRVGQIIGAMLQEALAGTRPGVATLLVSRLGLGAPMLQFNLRSPGPSVPAELADQLFLPFARRLGMLRDACAPATAGSGLALALAARLTELLGGQIGHGATADGQCEIWASLPLGIATPSEQPPTEPRAPVSITRPRRRANVLLVEDVVVNQVVTAIQLRREGHRVDVADDGATAVRMADAAPYDVIFMDLMMPGMSGFEATAHIRSLAGPAGRTPVVALTANTSPEDRARCLAAGMTEMLSKPLRPAELTGALARALDRPAVAARLDPPAATPAAPLFDERPGDAGKSGLISRDRLDELRLALPPEVFADVAERCLTDMTDMLRTLRSALDAGEVGHIDAASHALAGMCGGYGLAAIERRMRSIMRAARVADLTAAREAATGMEDEAGRSASALRALLPRMAGTA